MKLLDRYFTARIDRALDDAEPLDGLTVWYVRHRSALREYYETMLEMELELRFSNSDLNNEFPNDFTFRSNSRSDRQMNLFKNRLWIGLATVALIALMILPFFHLSHLSETQPIVSNTRNEKPQIDFAELFYAALPITEAVPTIENPFGTSFLLANIPPFEFPLEAIVDFTARPLESTLTVLETAGIVHSSLNNDEQN